VSACETCGGKGWVLDKGHPWPRKCRCVLACEQAATFVPVGMVRACNGMVIPRGSACPACLRSHAVQP
jgi:hypothetical protein